jgi:hypothetical protein
VNCGSCVVAAELVGAATSELAGTMAAELAGRAASELVGAATVAELAGGTTATELEETTPICPEGATKLASSFESEHAAKNATVTKGRIIFFIMTSFQKKIVFELSAGTPDDRIFKIICINCITKLAKKRILRDFQHILHFVQNLSCHQGLP